MRGVQIACVLGANPEVQGRAQCVGKLDGDDRRDGAATVGDPIDHLDVDFNVIGELPLGDLVGLQVVGL